MNSGETIIGLTNARIKFPDVTNLVCYLMNSDEDFDEAEFAFDWSEVEQEDLDDPNFDPYVDAVDLIRPSWDTWGPDPRYIRTSYPTSSTPAASPRLSSGPGCTTPSSPGCTTPADSGRGLKTRITTLKTGRWPRRTCVTWKTSTQT